MTKREFFCNCCRVRIDPEHPGDSFGYEWFCGETPEAIREIPITRAENHLCGTCFKAFKAFTPAPF